MFVNLQFWGNMNRIVWSNDFSAPEAELKLCVTRMLNK